MQSQSDANRSLNHVLSKNIKLQNTLTTFQTGTNSMYGMMYDMRNIAMTASNEVDYFAYMQTYFSALSNLDAYAVYSTDVNFLPS